MTERFRRLVRRWRPGPGEMAGKEGSGHEERGLGVSDPEEDAAARAAAERRRAVEAPVIADLRSEGLELDSLWDLSNDRAGDYSRHLPTLLDWLEKADDHDVKEPIVRALAEPWAKPEASRALVREFEDPQASEQYRWVVGNALDTLADEGVLDDMIRLSLDRRYGWARQMVVHALGRMPAPRVLDALESLLEEEDVSGHAVAALARLGSERARPHLERFVGDERAWVRQEARRGLVRLGPRR